MSSQSPKNAKEMGDFRLLSRTLSPEQLMGIRSALGCSEEIPVVPLATRLSKQIDFIRRMNRSDLEAVTRGAKVDMEAAQSPGKTGLEFGFASHAIEARHSWKEAEEKELMRLLEDASYRERVLGTAEIDFKLIGERFRRSESAIRKKCWSMAMKEQFEKCSGEAARCDNPGDRCGEATIGPGAVAKQTSPVSTGAMSGKRKWLDEENEEMQKLVESEAYRIKRGIQNEGSKTINWSVLARQFKNCKPGQAQKKFQALKSLARTNNGVIKKDRKQNRKHHQKKVAYKWMIVAVMRNFGGLRGTAPDIFAAIEAHDDFRSQLDTSIAPGTQQVPRWRTQVRKTLSAEKIFINTGTKVDKETVWELDMATVVDLVADNPKQRTGDLEKVAPMIG